VARREHDNHLSCARRTCGLDLATVVNEARSIALPAIGYGLFYQDYRFRLVDGTSSATTLMTYSKYHLGPLIKYCVGRGRFINARADKAPTACLVSKSSTGQSLDKVRGARCRTERERFKPAS
jgi:hypothetical protein